MRVSGTFSRIARFFGFWLISTGLLVQCTHKVQIEPSDKPFVVNLNVKVDHEIRHKIEKQNDDLLSLEGEATPKPAKKGKAKKGGKG